MLNSIQRNTLTEYSNDHLEAFRELDPEISIKALVSITNDNLYNQSSEEFQYYNILENVDAIRLVFSHPFPQNRAASGVYLPNPEAGYVYFYDDQRNIQKEPQGLFGLTGRNDTTASHVSRSDVISFFNLLIDAELEVQKIRLRDKEIAQSFIDKAKRDLDTTQDILTHTGQALERTADALNAAQEREQGLINIIHNLNEENQMLRTNNNNNITQIQEEQQIQPRVDTQLFDRSQVLELIGEQILPLKNEISTLKDKVKARKKQIEELKNSNKEEKLQAQARANFKIGAIGDYNRPKTGEVFQFAKKDDAADKKHKADCNDRISYGAYALATGAATALAATLAAPVILPAMGVALTAETMVLSFSAIATLKNIAISGATLGTLGTGMMSEGFISKKVGNQGKYNDVFEMAIKSMGHTAKLSAKDVRDHLQIHVIDKLKQGIIKGKILSEAGERDNIVQDKVKKRKDLGAAIDSLLNFKEVDPTDYKKFNKGVCNAFSLLIDLNTLQKAKKDAIKDNKKDESGKLIIKNNYGLKIISDRNTETRFLELTPDSQEKIFAATAGVISDTLIKIKDILDKDKKLDDLEIITRNAQTESCITM
ncbi:MAG: hypothetical protein ACK4OM_02080 [Alphaproteobacteria bacterium]